MSSNEQDTIRDYLNLLAVVCRHLRDYKQPAVSIPALITDDDEPMELLAELRQKRIEYGDVDLIPELSAIVSRIESDPSIENQYVKFYNMCLWMDSIITYEPAIEDASHFSIFGLVGDHKSELIRINSLNSNYESEGIWLIPKLPVSSSPIHTANQKSETNSETSAADRSIRIGEKANLSANRDSFAGMNGILHNVSVITYNPKDIITNAIVSPLSIQRILDSKMLNIACAPVTSNDDAVLIKKEGVTTRDGLSYHSIQAIIAADGNSLSDRIKEDWYAACTSANADILMFPEVLGTGQDTQIITLPNGNEFIPTIYELYKLSVKEKIPPPSIIILPILSEDGVNEAIICRYDGLVIARQKKYAPYVDRKKKSVEHIEESEHHEYTIIHIPGLHRIVILICSEFLNICQHGPMTLFEEAGATLVLVPSFSGGETDFMNVMQRLRQYGTTVIWGNCCGASDKPLKRIGACSPLDSYTVIDFSSRRKCDGTCDNIKSCLFTVSLPVMPSPAADGEIHSTDITHHVKRRDSDSNSII